MSRFHTIVAALDFSDSALDELPQLDLHAVEQTWKRGALEQLAALVVPHHTLRNPEPAKPPATPTSALPS